MSLNLKKQNKPSILLYDTQTKMTEYKLVVVGGNFIYFFKNCFYSLFDFLAGGVGKSALTIQLIQNQ